MKISNLDEKSHENLESLPPSDSQWVSKTCTAFAYLQIENQHYLLRKRNNTLHQILFWKVIEIWRAEKSAIGRLKREQACFPELPLRIKAYIAPNSPIGPSELTEHQLHIYSAAFKKSVFDKAELFVLGTTKNYIWYCLSISGIAIAAAIFIIVFFWCAKHEKINVPDGYVMMLDEEHRNPERSLRLDL